ncbi:uncharacterized protein LOC128670356 [Plodia interpunctella]|uniref:uncharacterized protein LOC128670356 n=1 Tax=Plodia interpunctella TaxID=58824 RepID=UPI002367B6C7|nr:uncharacterized protein LOC128670356 [Plodia interpunctella]XP_053601933.1 uncharacterized protein LOC128670356 [Plodia interpunctella]
MHMWLWSGYDLGEFLFPGLEIDSRWAFALTWLALFFVAMLFEGSKVYLAEVQRDAQKKLYPYRSDERRNLLCERDQGNPMEPTTSRNTNPVSRWASLRVRALVNLHQSAVFVTHNVVGYLLMLAVMIYNVHLILAVVFGMMVGYFLFGTSLTRLQMKCFSTKRVVICTPECDDTAEGSTPPLLDSSAESDYFICRTRTCIQPSHYFPAAAGASDHPTCHYGAKTCPSKVAKGKKIIPQPTPSTSHHESEKEDSPSVEDVQLLRTERQGCCKEKVEKCGKSSQDTTVVVHEQKCCKKERETPEREESPQITCCHAKVPSESQEQIM